MSSISTTSRFCRASTMALAALASVEAFTPTTPITGSIKSTKYQKIASPSSLRMASDAKDEVAMLKEMAAKARAEAAALAKVRMDSIDDWTDVVTVYLD